METTPLPAQESPDFCQFLTVQTPVAITNVPISVLVGIDAIVDEVLVCWNTGTSTGTLDLAWVEPGGDFASGTTIASISFTGLAARTVHRFTVDEANNLIMAGENGVVVGWAATGTAPSDATYQIRFRTKQR